MTSPFTFLRGHWQATLGWVIFLALLGALAVDHYVFDPFIFGSAYYAIYVITRLRKPEERGDLSLMDRRMIALCAIALLYMWIALRHNIDEGAFIARFERACYRSSIVDTDSEQRLCEEVQSAIEATIRRESNFTNE